MAGPKQIHQFDIEYDTLEDNDYLPISHQGQTGKIKSSKVKSFSNTGGGNVSVNREVLSATLILTEESAYYQFLELALPGSDRDILLPENPRTGTRFRIEHLNVSSQLTLRVMVGTTIAIALGFRSGYSIALCVFDGTDWQLEVR
jgi:hypothetical protein